VAEKRLQFAIANLGSVSDVLLSTPLLESLRQTNPSCRITYIVARSSAEALDYSPFVNELIIWPDDSRSPGNGLRLVRQLARKHFDGAFALISNTYVNAAFRLSRSRIHTAAPSRGVHRARSFLDVAKDLGPTRPETIRLHYTVTPTEQREASMMLERWNIDPSRQTVIGVHPGTGPTLIDKRRWSVQSFRDVIHHIAAKPNHKVVIFGGTAERDTAAVLTEKPLSNVVDLTSCLNFREFVAVLAQCHLLVHNASAPMYLANAVGVPVLAIMGHQDGTVWGPLSPRDRVVRRELPCSPCAPEFPCDRAFECLRNLAPSEVIAELDAMLPAARVISGSVDTRRNP